MSKKIYPSKYTDKMVGASQYLADEICERIAKKDGKSLPYKYWNLPQWEKIYLHQVTAAAKLLQECSVVVIMTFLRSVKGRNIYSLGLKKQILAGVATIKLVDDIIRNNETAIYTTDDDSIIEEFDNIKEYHEETKSSVSLWEKLG